MAFFKDFSAWALLIDFFWASLFLWIAQVIRLKVKIFQKLFIPASVLAGFVAMILGPGFLKVIGFSGQATSYPGVLVAMLFATLMLGHEEKTQSFGKSVWKVRDQFLNIALNSFFQFGTSILLGLLLVKVFFPHINEAVGILMPAGWYGGYGFAGAIGSVLGNYGFEDATGIGMTLATTGLLSGIIAGMVYVNIACRRGNTKYTAKLSEIPEDIRSGLLKGENQFSSGTATVSPSTIDPVGYHWCLVFAATGFGWIINYYIKQASGVDVPVLCLAMLCGLAIQGIMKLIGLGESVDKKTINRIGGTCTDYLVFFGFLSIRGAVIADYWSIILILSVFGFIFCSFSLWMVSPKVFLSSWFEKGIFQWGMFTGNVASGVTLLRVIDPQGESRTLEDYGIANIPFSWIDMVQISLYPILLGLGYTWQVGLGLVLLGFVTIGILRAVGCWHKAYMGGGEYEKILAAKEASAPNT